MPFANSYSWPPTAPVPNQDRVVRRCVWPPGGDLLWLGRIGSGAASPSASGYSGGGDEHGGLDAEAAREIIQRAKVEASVPTHATSEMEQMREAWLALHSWHDLK